ncbi:MAG: polysaccharide deacetylase [Solirubrobacterales bacterium]|nr:polysaccharide deacetylase [Solirubrobacterales bacterium]
MPVRRVVTAARAAEMRRRIRRPPAHWSLLGFCLTTLLVLLFVQGVTVRTIGASATPTTRSRTAPLAGSRPILTAVHGRLVSRQPAPGRRIALTFDDGPSARWTPKIAAVLRRLHVPAAFFVVGSQAVRYPSIVRMLHDDGFELGDHTFTHADLASLPGWERSLQVGLTESALAGIVGTRTHLLRPPYAASPVAVTPAQYRAYLGLAEDGYLIALSDYDARDWERPGVSAIVRNATPPGRQGGIVLMHDAGGDRSETLAALPRLIARLRARGFRFVTVSALAGLGRASTEIRASWSQESRGWLLVQTLAVARFVTTALTIVLIPIAALMILRAIFVVVLARRHARAARRQLHDPTFRPSISVVVPAYNEAVGIERAVRSLVTTTHPEVEVIVVDDGSEDETADIVHGLELPGVHLIRQANAGKPAALNRGIAAAGNEVIVMVDADTVFEPETLSRLVAPMEDPGVGAASGNTKVGNRRGLLGRWQHIEYVMGFNLDRRLYDTLRCMPTIPGAIGAFRREALADVGGLSAATLAEDTDVTLALGRAGWRVVYVEHARAWTEAPSTLRALWRQRYRWSYGTMQAVWKHRAAIWRPGEQRIGRRGIPYLVLFQILLPMLAPLIDVFAVYGLVFLDPVPVIAYWGGFNVLQILLAAYAFRLDHESLRPLWAIPVQQLVYRQLMYLVVIESAISAMLGVRLRWHHLDRTGEVEVAREI